MGGLNNKVKTVFLIGLLIGSFGFSKEMYQITDKEPYQITDRTVISPPKERTEKAMKAFETKVLTHPLIRDLREDLKDKASQERYNKCVVSGAENNRWLPADTIGILCAVSGQESIRGISYLYGEGEGDGSFLSITGLAKEPIQIKMVPAPQESGSNQKLVDWYKSGYFENQCQSSAAKGVELVQVPGPLFVVLADSSALLEKDWIHENGSYVSDIIMTSSKDKKADLERKLKEFNLTPSDIFVMSSSMRSFFCTRCPIGFVSNGYDCHNDQCSAFDLGCLKNKECPEGSHRVVDKCIEDFEKVCREKEEKLLYRLRATEEDIKKYVGSPISFSFFNSAYALEFSTNLDSLDKDEVTNLLEARLRTIRELLRQVREGLKSVKQNPNVNYCKNINFSPFDFDQSFLKCKETGGIRDSKGVCQPEACYACPYPLYTGPVAVAGCSASETQVAVEMLKQQRAGARCVNGKCQELAPITVGDVQRALQSLGVTCNRQNGEIYLKPKKTSSHGGSRSRGGGSR